MVLELFGVPVQLAPNDFLVTSVGSTFPKHLDMVWGWLCFVVLLSALKQAPDAVLLRTLVIVDRYPPPPTRTVFEYHHCLEQRFKDLTELVWPLKMGGMVEHLTIELRYPYNWAPYVDIGNYPYLLLATSNVPRHLTDQEWTCHPPCSLVKRIFR